jgi:hypothetical protein
LEWDKRDDVAPEVCIIVTLTYLCEVGDWDGVGHWCQRVSYDEVKAEIDEEKDFHAVHY